MTGNGQGREGKVGRRTGGVEEKLERRMSTDIMTCWFKGS